MTYDTFGTIDLNTLATWVWEAGWDHVLGAIWTKDGMTGRLEMRDGYYALVAMEPA